MVKIEEFGMLSDGRKVKKVSIYNSDGEHAEILNYGASVSRIYVRGRDGEFHNVAFGVDSAEQIEQRNKLGKTVGRVANRIRNGRCVIGGKEVQLEVREDGHFLHSCSADYGKRIFEVTAESEDTAFFYLRDEGGAGFTVPVDACVRIRFTDAHELIFDYEFIPHGTTLLCPTNHAYFNLNGFGDVREDEMQISADSIAVRVGGMPDGTVKAVEGTIFDFRSLTVIGNAAAAYPEQFAANGNIYDDVFLLNGEGFRDVALLKSEKTGICMKTSTDMPAIVCFIPGGVFRNEKGEEVRVPYESVCLECQYVPNAVNIPSFEGYEFREGEKFVSETKYTFSVC